MEDKTPLYMIIIVGIVALVGLITVLTHGSSGASYTNTNAVNSNTAGASGSESSGLTGNDVAGTGDVVSNTGSSPIFLNSFGKIFFAVFMLGMVVYLYFRVDE